MKSRPHSERKEKSKVDPRLADLVRYLARRAAERDYAQGLAASEGSRRPKANGKSKP
jgi:hypothetical protein